MVTFLKNLLNPANGLAVSKATEHKYRTIFPLVVTLHLGAAILAGVFSIGDNPLYNSTDPTNEQSRYNFDAIRFFTSFALVQIITNVLIIWYSARNEAIGRQNLDSYKGLSRSVAHTFSNFEEHIVWLLENLSPTQYGKERISLFTTVSTPVYGLGSNDWNESTDKYFLFLEQWVEHFEFFPEAASDPPNWTMTIWNPTSNVRVFNEAINFEENNDKIDIIDKFSLLFKRIYQLHADGKINFRLYFSDETHTRWFYVKNSFDRYDGLLVIFSPLSASAVKTGRWQLCGVSFEDSDTFKNLASFNYRLMHEDHDKSRTNRMVEAFENPDIWLRDHYQIDVGSK